MAFQPADTDDWLSQLKEPKCGCHKYIEKEIDAKCARLEPWKPGNEPGTDATFDGRHLTLLSISKWKISGPPIDCADVKKHLTFTHSNSAKGRNVTQDRSSLRVPLLIVTPDISMDGTGQELAAAPLQADGSQATNQTLMVQEAPVTTLAMTPQQVENTCMTQQLRAKHPVTTLRPFLHSLLMPTTMS
ncbi:hypothetical protein PENNAL_c0039G07629 [Penicillium nalgiovense]|uniref:Uncharacterized protein n=1 Tax=Penicillium nalgiovense TaxID=60175 RepID=A0A1V6Y304_PENNA|nr:hypothetical protein PENNAL_c0039G07629 [Penicillium nalgiovense]